MYKLNKFVDENENRKRLLDNDIFPFHTTYIFKTNLYISNSSLSSPPQKKYLYFCHSPQLPRENFLFNLKYPQSINFRARLHSAQLKDMENFIKLL